MDFLHPTYLQVFLTISLPIMGLAYALVGGLKLSLAERLGLDEGKVGRLVGGFGTMFGPTIVLCGFLADAVGRQGRRFRAIRILALWSKLTTSPVLGIMASRIACISAREVTLRQIRSMAVTSESSIQPSISVFIIRILSATGTAPTPRLPTRPTQARISSSSVKKPLMTPGASVRMTRSRTIVKSSATWTIPPVGVETNRGVRPVHRS